MGKIASIRIEWFQVGTQVPTPREVVHFEQTRRSHFTRGLERNWAAFDCGSTVEPVVIFAALDGKVRAHAFSVAPTQLYPQPAPPSSWQVTGNGHEVSHVLYVDSGLTLPWQVSGPDGAKAGFSALHLVVDAPPPL
jgi:hypothetical protein